MSLARQAIDQHGAAQKELELDGLIELLAGREIRRVLEIGSQDGGMLWLFAQIATEFVVGVDLTQGVTAVCPIPIVWVEGDSHSSTIRERIPEGPYDLLFIDGDHSYAGVCQDFTDYAPLVAPDGVIAFHDIVPHPNPTLSEVDRLWRELKTLWPGETRELICPCVGETWRGQVPEDSCGIGVLLP